MPIAAVVLVPTHPGLLAPPTPDPTSARPEPSSDQPGAVARAALEAAMARLPPTSTVLLLVADDESLVLDAPRAVATLPGGGSHAAAIVLDTALIAAVSARGQAPRVRSEQLSGSAATLALLLHRARPELPVAPVTIPRRASATGLSRVATGLAAAIVAIDRSVVVLASGDLAPATNDASSPPGPVGGGPPDADVLARPDGWNAAALAAIRAVDPEALGGIGPQAAQRVGATGWAPITVAVDLAAQAGDGFPEVTFTTTDGVGQVIAG